MRIFLASSFTNEELKAIEISGHKNILVSYYYLRKMSAEKLRRNKEWVVKNNITLFLDSGTFSLRSDKKVVVLSKIEQLMVCKKYAADYAKFVEEWYDVIYAYAELDVDPLIGLEEVIKLRSYFSPSILPKLCPVHHFDTRKKIDFTTACDSHNFMGIGTSPTISVNDAKIYGSFAKYSIEHKTRLHGFALINIKLLSAVPFASVDSTAWQSGGQFGEVNYFDQNTKTIRRLRLRRDNKAVISRKISQVVKIYPHFMRLWESKHLSPVETRRAGMICSAVAFNQMEKHLTDLWKLRGVDFSKMT